MTILLFGISLIDAPSGRSHMVPNIQFVTGVLVLTVAVLLYAAFTDLKHYKIGNGLIVLLVGLFLLHSLLSNRWANAAWSIGLATGVFLFLLYFYSRHWIGGGDVKILSVAFLWAGIECALPFVLLLLLFVSLHTVAARLGWAASQQNDSDGRFRIPFAPSITAALIATILLGCLRSPV
jgi:prepilin peptidase CpaA